MRQILAVVALVMAVACEKAPTRTDRGDGTTIVTSGSLKGLVCTNPDCSGITDLTVTGTDLYSVNLARLTSVGSLVISGNAGLARVVLPALTSTDTLQVSSNASLTSLSLPALAAVDRHLIVSDDCLTSLSLPALTTVGRDLIISANQALTSLNLPVLTNVGSLTVTDNTAFPQCSAVAILAHLVNYAGPATLSGNDPTAVCSGEGADTRTFAVGGTITGLTGSGLVLATPGQADLQVAAGETTFAFPVKLPVGGPYDVTVIGQPTGPAQTCQVGIGTGLVGTADVTRIAVTCAAAPTSYFDGPRAVVQLINAWGGYCSGTAFVGNRSATAPVYVLTAGHCYAITFGDEVFADVPNSALMAAYFNYFPDAPAGAPFTVGVTGIRYSTMWGHDLSLLELDTDQVTLASRGVTLPTLAAVPPAGGGVFTYGFRADEPVMRRSDFTLGPQVWLKESVWSWMSVFRGEGPVTYVRGGSSGSPVFALDTSEIFGVINTRSEEIPTPTCQLNYPCEVGPAGVVNVPLRAYFQDATRLKGCFSADGLFDRALAGCRLPGSTFFLQSVAGQPNQLAVVENTGGLPAGAYRYRVSPLATFDPADASGYAASTTAPSFTFAPAASPFVVTALSETDFHAEGIDPLALHAVVFWQ